MTVVQIMCNIDIAKKKRKTSCESALNPGWKIRTSLESTMRQIM